jgi:hypothetical protein
MSMVLFYHFAAEESFAMNVRSSQRDAVETFFSSAALLSVFSGLFLFRSDSDCDISTHLSLSLCFYVRHSLVVDRLTDTPEK